MNAKNASATVLTIFGIPNCDTVKKSRKWFDERGVAYVFHDFKKQGVDAAHLNEWMEHSGWDVVLNRKGTTWRQLPPEAQAAVLDAASAARVLLEHHSAIKRPVCEWRGADGKLLQLTIGFAPQQWESTIQGFA